MKGNELEKRANKANLKYRIDLKALILKVPTPIVMTKKGLVAEQSTVDYTGTITGGLSIAFDAKEVMSKTSFPLSNIKEHQLQYLQFTKKLGGITFFLIHFKAVYKDQAFITPISLVESYWDGAKRKSIPFTDFQDSWLCTIENYIDKVIDLKEELLK